MNKKIFCTALVIALSLPHVVWAADTPADKFTGQKFEKYAKIKIKEARTLALKARPGTIVDEELEKERGGSGLRYSFDIKRNSVEYEVGIDAQSGEVLENDKEGKNPD